MRSAGCEGDHCGFGSRDWRSRGARLERNKEDSSWVDDWKEFVAAIRGNRTPVADGYDGW
jgi:hypothetical protein